MKVKPFMAILLLFPFGAFAQRINWQNLDLQNDHFFGISTEKAYQQLLVGKKAKTVIVGIIDSGVDTTHEDLKSVLWVSKDSVHGANYIAGVEHGQEDITYFISAHQAFYDSLSYTVVPLQYREGYQQYRTLLPVLNDKIKAMQKLVEELTNKEDSITAIVTKIGKAEPEAHDFISCKATNENEQKLVSSIIKLFPKYKNWSSLKFNEVDHILTMAKYHLTHGLNVSCTEPDNTSIDSDVSPDKLGLTNEPNYTAWHGTHVAGIIGAVRQNNIGLDGIADHVELMMLKTNGNIRELRDENLAKAIRFAVDHGAKVINMSFGKPYSWNKNAVDEAVKYAVRHDVLLVHAAGNDGDDIDQVNHFPNPVYADKSGKADPWIEVGASRPYDDTVLVAAFSNFGKHTVDVFAPGTGIYSSIPGSGYEKESGTSMAAPVVTGLAALIREYYPQLSAVQVKEIIMRSVIQVTHKVYVAPNGKLHTVQFSDVCISGGIVNAYNALKLAATYK